MNLNNSIIMSVNAAYIKAPLRRLMVQELKVVKLP
jgi:hypothetical protein